MSFDAYLENGDYVYDDAGGVKSSSDKNDALLRRCLDRLKARRGGFLLDSEFGSQLWRLAREQRRGRDSAAMRYASEALEPEGVRVLSASCADGANGIDVSVTVECDDSVSTLSITV